MNYRHAFHAGNFADVVKHATVALVIEHLKLKSAPFRVVDTHAGVGRYDLLGPEASKTGEWLDGIGRLAGADLPPEIGALLSPYLSSVAALNEAPLTRDTIRAYPGSPLVARHLLRPDDKLIVNELHPQDHASLEALFEGDRQTKVMDLDGWTALKAVLPPPERRGLMLVDPPFEEPGELARLVQGLRDAARRFETGIAILWYAIKDERVLVPFRRELAESGLEKLLDVTLMVRSANGAGLAGCGLVIMNPPFGLESKLRRLTEFLAEALAVGEGAMASVRWLAGERVR